MAEKNPNWRPAAIHIRRLQAAILEHPDLHPIDPHLMTRLLMNGSLNGEELVRVQQIRRIFTDSAEGQEWQVDGMVTSVEVSSRKAVSYLLKPVGELPAIMPVPDVMANGFELLLRTQDSLAMKVYSDGWTLYRQKTIKDIRSILLGYLHLRAATSHWVAHDQKRETDIRNQQLERENRRLAIEVQRLLADQRGKRGKPIVEPDSEEDKDDGDK